MFPRVNRRGESMSHWCVQDLIAEICPTDSEMEEVARLEEQLKSVTDALADVKSCPWPQPTQMKNIKFESRSEYIKALLECARFIKECINEVGGGVHYLRVNSGAYCGVCQRKCCRC